MLGIALVIGWALIDSAGLPLNHDVSWLRKTKAAMARTATNATVPAKLLSFCALDFIGRPPANRALVSFRAPDRARRGGRRSRRGPSDIRARRREGSFRL